MKYNLLVPLILLCGCGVPQSEYDELKSDYETIKTELEELLNGEERLIALIERNYEEGNYVTAKKNIQLLYDYHPASTKNKHYQNLSEIITEEEITKVKVTVENCISKKNFTEAKEALTNFFNLYPDLADHQS